ncbi:MAG: nucleotidyltransferase [Candidatus Lokiarchaeota archaeon]|nr:nucleotidyltransferase [Candidatus Lokiarchaeota archaeon]
MAKICKKYKKILIAYLYGSCAVEKHTKFSDIDISVVLINDFEEPPLYFAQLANKFEKAFHNKINIDLRILNKQPPHFLFQVIKTGEIIYYRDRNFKDEFELRVITQYLDIKPLLDYFDNLFVKEVLGDKY